MKKFKKFIKKNLAVVLVFVLPIVLISTIALSVYIPSLFLLTKYNFVYASCPNNYRYENYGCESYMRKYFSVDDGVLQTHSTKELDALSMIDSDLDPYVDARLFFHDTQKNESREITIGEAQMMNLDAKLTSPDGAIVVREYNSNISYPLSVTNDSSYGYFLKKGQEKEKMNLLSGNMYYQDFYFVGWVLPGRN